MAPTDATADGLRAVAGLTRSSSRRSPKVSEVLAQQLANYVTDANLSEGARLPNERELAEIFGVGRTTLREALRLLETRGALIIRPGPNGGPVVRRPRPADLAESLALILQLNDASLRHVFEARRALEPTMARLAAERISAEALVELDETVERALAHLHDPEGFVSESTRFHTLIARATGNPALEAFYESLTSIANGAALGTQHEPHRRQLVAEAHRRIVDALRAGDLDGAEAAMRDHVEDAVEYWQNKNEAALTANVRWVRP